MHNLKNSILVTGSAGFIGYHLCSFLLDSGCKVVGVDNMNDYYDVGLKLNRHKMLKQYKNFSIEIGDISDQEFMGTLGVKYDFSAIVHLAAQAGVRNSIEKPQEYLKSNIIGSFNILELARTSKVEHLLMASTSSVYGSNKKMPFKESDKCDTQISFYAATKKSMEVMAHSHSHIFKIPTTIFRFFTVYGTWGRPDMAMYKFADAIIKNESIDIYNYGKMKRDFTYVKDLVRSIALLIKVHPVEGMPVSNVEDSLSNVAPYRTVNIGNSTSVELMAVIAELEARLGQVAKKNFIGMQQGDVKETVASTDLLEALIDYKPNTNIVDGVSSFVTWFLDYGKN